MTKSTRCKRAKVKPELSRFTVGEHNVDEVIAGITRREREPCIFKRVGKANNTKMLDGVRHTELPVNCG